MILLTVIAALISPVEGSSAPMSLSLVGVGRFAVMADTANRPSDPDGVRMRALQVSEEDLLIGEKRYIGGWSWWRFDCEARTADRLDFASLTDDLTEGTITPDHQPPYTISPGGDAAELFAVACGEVIPAQDASTLEEAVRLARKAISD